MKNKLNLGCGLRKIHGFINIDMDASVCPDIVDDVTLLATQADYSASLIVASHVLEHSPSHRDAILTLSRWQMILSKGGILRIAVPDMEQVCKHYIYHRDLRLLRGFIWGGHKSSYDIHHTGWDFDHLKVDLESIGFTNVKRYDWRHTEHFYVDSYEQAYLPHMDKTNGKLFSLNVEATVQ